IQNSENARKGMPISAPGKDFLRPNRKGSGLPDQSTRSPGTVRVASIIGYRRLAPVLGALLLHVTQVLVEHDAALAGGGDEALAGGATDQGEVGLARKLDAPGGEA